MFFIEIVYIQCSETFQRPRVWCCLCYYALLCTIKNPWSRLRASFFRDIAMIVQKATLSYIHPLVPSGEHVVRWTCGVYDARYILTFCIFVVWRTIYRLVRKHITYTCTYGSIVLKWSTYNYLIIVYIIYNPSNSFWQCSRLPHALWHHHHY